MPIVGGGTLVGGKYQFFEHPTYPQFSAYAPDGLGAGENIRITHFVYDNDPNKSNEELAKLQSTVWVALLVPFAGDNIQYGIPIAEGVPRKADNSTKNHDLVFNVSVPVPIEAHKFAIPPLNAVKVAIYNSTAVSINPTAKDLYHFSPGFYLRPSNGTQSQSTEWVPTPGLNSMGIGAVITPSGREIAIHGAIGIGIGLGTIFVTLVCQLVFLRFCGRRGSKGEHGTWQEKLNLTEKSALGRAKEDARLEAASERSPNLSIVSLTPSSTVSMGDGASAM
ncbi:hypothetical protein BS50DRAFT_573851 [Corynespora cassiicola Philippines]|uniref:Uncharacterized protein n=1 Tax=Corynespora cassiicola Philippines TaxID=1448308 RepID=A0A2T2NNU9_CORCC|nr:hypothetical protein BS50DRAFT_573851 [Corynespora cassiicola Philippines]